MKLQCRSQSDVHGLSDGELHNTVLELQKLRDRVEAEQAKVLCEWQRRRLWADDGSRSSGARYARETGLSKDDATRLMTRAIKLYWMPKTLAAFAKGEISSSRVNLLARARANRVHGAFERDEETLLDTIKDLSFAGALRTVRYWHAHADEEGAKRRGDKLNEQRSAYVSTTFEGAVDFRALFDPIGGEIFSNEVERLDKQLFEADWAEAKVEYGDDVCVEKLKRTAAQRRCDALVLMAERSATAGANGNGRVLVSVVAGEQSFARLCETARGTVLAPSQIVPWLEKVDIERIVFDGPSRILDLGQQRSFRGALRRALEVRDRHCQHESGCDVPARDCQGDHITAHSRGGKTSQTNGQLLCPRHNRSKGSGPPC